MVNKYQWSLVNVNSEWWWLILMIVNVHVDSKWWRIKRWSILILSGDSQWCFSFQKVMSPENILSSHFFHIEQKLESGFSPINQLNFPAMNAHVHPEKCAFPQKIHDFPHQSADFPTQKMCFSSQNMFPFHPTRPFFWSRSLWAAEVCRSSGCFETGPGGHHFGGMGLTWFNHEKWWQKNIVHLLKNDEEWWTIGALIMKNEEWWNDEK